MPTINVPINGQWRTVQLTDVELTEIDEKAYAEHNEIMSACVSDAERIFPKPPPAPEVAIIASALFAMRARPLHYMREEAAREKWLKERDATQKIRMASPE